MTDARGVCRRAEEARPPWVESRKWFAFTAASARTDPMRLKWLGVKREFQGLLTVWCCETSCATAAQP